MRSKGGISRFWFFPAVLLLWGCSANAPYRDFTESQSAADFGGYLGSEPQQPGFYPRNNRQPYDLAFIEFDEKGDFWDREQLGHAYKELAKLGADKSKPPLLFVYIHGWQNNASDKTHDVASFKGFLSRLAKNSHLNKNYQVFGVYLGWRGMLVPGGNDPVSHAALFLPHELSFWSRKDTATRVAGEPMAEAIFAMVHAARKTHPQARTVLIGHSFGALVLEKTLAQALPASFYAQEDAGGEKARYLPPADMILLLNSASESIYAKELMDMFRRAHFSGEVNPERPLILSVTSEGDWATGDLFPAGADLSNALGTFRTYKRNAKYDGAAELLDQREFFTTTPGWNEHLISHRVVCLNPGELRKVKNPNGSEDGASSLDPSFDINLEAHDSNLLKFCTEPEGHKLWWEIQPQKGFMQSPYWIIKVPKEIIPDHGGIWLDSSVDMMAALYTLAVNGELRSAPCAATLGSP